MNESTWLMEPQNRESGLGLQRCNYVLTLPPKQLLLVNWTDDSISLAGKIYCKS